MEDFNKIIEEYRNHAILHCRASREGDYKTANKNYTKLTKIYKLFCGNEELKEKSLSHLLNDRNYCVKAWAAAHCLGLGIFKEDAISRLEHISKMSANEAPSFEARMTLQEWREKGTLTF